MFDYQEGTSVRGCEEIDRCPKFTGRTICFLLLMKIVKTETVNVDFILERWIRAFRCFFVWEGFFGGVKGGL